MTQAQKEEKVIKISRVILAVHNSPNKSSQRAALWVRLLKLRQALKD